MGVALLLGEERHLVQPARLLRDALVAEGFRDALDDPPHQVAPEPRRQHAVVVEQPLADEAVVAGEALVAAIAGEHHLDRLAGHPGHQVDAGAERVGRLVHVVDHRRDQAEQVGLDHLLVRLHAVARGDASGVGQLVEALLLDADREGRDGLLADRRHERGDQAGIDAAAQERADPHVAQQVHLDGLAQQRVQLVDHLAPRAGWAGSRTTAASTARCVTEPSRQSSQLPAGSFSMPLNRE